MKTIARLLLRAGVPEQTVIVFLYRVFYVPEAVKEHLPILRGFAIIKIYRMLYWSGAHAAAEWFARVSGLRARVEAALGRSDAVE